MVMHPPCIEDAWFGLYRNPGACDNPVWGVVVSQARTQARSLGSKLATHIRLSIVSERATCCPGMKLATTEATSSFHDRVSVRVGNSSWPVLLMARTTYARSVFSTLLAMHGVSNRRRGVR